MKCAWSARAISRPRCSRRCAGRRRRVHQHRRARRRRPAGAGGARRRPAGARAGQPEDRARRGDPRGHRPDHRRAHPCARQRRGAGPLAPRRRRLSPVAAAAPPRHRRRRVDDPRRRPHRRRLGLPPGRRLGCRRHRGAGLVLRRSAARRARELWERALAPMGLALLQRVVRHARDARRACRPGAGPALRDQGADDPALRRADRGPAATTVRWWSR